MPDISAPGVLVPEDACTLGELGPALAESDIVVVDEPSVAVDGP